MEIGTAGGNTIGTAPCSNIYGLKTLDINGKGYSSYIVSALNVVKQRHLANPYAKSVVSMSLSGSCGSTCVENIVNQGQPGDFISTCSWHSLLCFCRQ